MNQLATSTASLNQEMGGNLKETTQPGFLKLILSLYISPTLGFLALKKRPRVLYPLLGLIMLGVLSNLALVKRVGLHNFYAKIFDQSVAEGTMGQAEAKKRVAELMEQTSESQLVMRLVLQSVIQTLLFTLLVAGAFKMLTFLYDGDNNFIYLAIFQIVLRMR